MIHGVFDLDDQTTRDLMVPRTQIVALPQTATIREEIVGDFDDESSLQAAIIHRQTEEGLLFVDPSARLDDLGSQIGYELEPATYNTLAGLIYHHLGQLA